MIASFQIKNRSVKKLLFFYLLQYIFKMSMINSWVDKINMLLLMCLF